MVSTARCKSQKLLALYASIKAAFVQRQGFVFVDKLPCFFIHVAALLLLLCPWLSTQGWLCYLYYRIPVDGSHCCLTMYIYIYCIIRELVRAIAYVCVCVHACKLVCVCVCVCIASQTFRLPLVEVHVPRCPGGDEHPAGQHQRLLRPHHPVHQQRLRLRPLRGVQLRGQLTSSSLTHISRS